MHKTTAYSLDLRERVVKAAHSGLKKQTIVNRYGVSISSLNRWLRLEARSELAPKQDWRKGHSHRIKNLDSFRQFVDANKDLTHAQMAAKWGNISETSIGTYLKKIGYTRKKNLFYMLSAMKKHAKSSQKP